MGISLVGIGVVLTQRRRGNMQILRNDPPDKN
jgi:hypothetical protein